MHQPGRLSRVAWTVVGLLWVVALLNYLDRQLVVTMPGPIKADLGIGDERFGLLSSVFLWVYGFCSPVAGYVADRFGKRPVIIASLLIWSAATFYTGIAELVRRNPRRTRHARRQRSLLHAGRRVADRRVSPRRHPQPRDGTASQRRLRRFGPRRARRRHGRDVRLANGIPRLRRNRRRLRAGADDFPAASCERSRFTAGRRNAAAKHGPALAGRVQHASRDTELPVPSRDEFPERGGLLAAAELVAGILSRRTRRQSDDGRNCTGRWRSTAQLSPEC